MKSNAEVKKLLEEAEKLFNGIDCTKDEKRAFELYQSAAKEGSAKAKYKIGFCYANGLGGVEQNEKTAFEWVRLAAKEKDIEALHALGYCYEKGLGTQPDSKVALRCYKEAASRGHAPAQYNLAVCLEKGLLGLTKNLGEAFRYYEDAAKQNLPIAQAAVARFLFKGTDLNKAKAAQYLLAAETGMSLEPSENFLLGECYKEGFGVTKDRSKAFDYYKLAADKGNAEAKFALGGFYEESYTAEAKKIALEFYEAAAETLPLAAMSAGDFYKNGYGVPQNKQKALFYYKSAMDKGSITGKWSYEELAKNLEREKSGAPLYTFI